MSGANEGGNRKAEHPEGLNLGMTEIPNRCNNRVCISRDHHYDNELFSSLKEDDEISVKIIGHRFELYDDNISVIAELNEKKLNKKSKAVK